MLHSETHNLGRQAVRRARRRTRLGLLRTRAAASSFAMDRHVRSIAAGLQDPMAEDLFVRVVAGEARDEGEGPLVVRGLCALLMTPDPAGRLRARERAAHILAAWGETKVLIDYLAAPPEPLDELRLAGELTVINAASRSIVGLRDPRSFAALLKLALRWRARGAIEALGEFNWPQAIPGLVAGLYSDETRPAATAALLRSGRRAVPILLETVRRPPWRDDVEGTRQRARQTATHILSQLELSQRQHHDFTQLIGDTDPEIAAQACLVVLRAAIDGPIRRARRRLAELLPYLSSSIREASERALAHDQKARLARLSGARSSDGWVT